MLMLMPLKTAVGWNKTFVFAFAANVGSPVNQLFVYLPSMGWFTCLEEISTTNVKSNVKSKLKLGILGRLANK